MDIGSSDRPFEDLAVRLAMAACRPLSCTSSGFGRRHGCGGGVLASGKGLQETEIREGLKEGGRILGLFVVERASSPEEPVEFVVYVRPSWTRGYRILRTWRDKGDRAFRDFDRMLPLLRDLGYDGPVTVYKAGCVELGKFRGVLVRDGGIGEAQASSWELDQGRDTREEQL